MRQKAYLGVVALSAIALVGVGCSSDDNNNTSGSGGATAAQGGSSSAGGSGAKTGGAANTGGAKTSAGGTTSAAGGTTSAAGGVTSGVGGTTAASTTSGTKASTGGAPAAGGTTSTATTSVGGAQLTPGSNLINDSCETTGSADDMGVVGGFYLFGDSNAEHPNGQSCTLPASGTNVCEQEEDGGTKTGVCLAGSTIKDSTYAAWGCGIGLSLNSTGSGDGGTGKSPYSGPATCFQLTFTGTTGGLALRVGFTQFADTSIASQSVAPYKPVTFSNGWTGTVCFEDVVCPPWPNAPSQGCPGDLVATPSSSYDLQITVPGGGEAANYDLCLTSVVPLKPQTP